MKRQFLIASLAAFLCAGLMAQQQAPAAPAKPSVLASPVAVLAADFQRDVLKLQRDLSDMEKNAMQIQKQYDDYLAQARKKYQEIAAQLALKKSEGDASCAKLGQVFDEASVACADKPKEPAASAPPKK